MSLTLAKTQAVSDLAEFMADFLPGDPHPFADQTISFRGIAHALRVERFWVGGSKTPAVTRLLAGVLEHESRQFCTVVVEAVRRGIRYRQKKAPITRQDIETLQALVAAAGFRIRDLEDPEFIRALPSASRPARRDTRVPVENEATTIADKAVLDRLKTRLDELAGYAPSARGIAFEGFLNELFQAFGLAPKGAFSLRGEQIDGSCEVGGNTYLVEAKWTSDKTGQGDLLILSGKVGGKAQWARGLFVSFGGFSQQGLEAFKTGKQTNLICVDRDDLRCVLGGQIHLGDLIQRKARRAGEVNAAFVPASELL
jgi:hypothetical protein